MTITQIKSPEVGQDQSLRSAILATLAYSDIFDFPLRADEIAHYLIGQQASVEEVSEALASDSSLSAKTCSDHGYYALAGRASVFVTRKERAARSATMLAQAEEYGKSIGNLPFVRMVAVTGAVAAGNAQPGADLDYFIVTTPGWLWLCRLMVLVLNRVSKLAGLKAELCPNYLITENALALQERDLFSAEEFVRMIPVYGSDIYEHLRTQNSWVTYFLPAAQDHDHQNKSEKESLLKRSLESVMAALQLSWLERWEMQRKIKKFSLQYTFNSESRFAADYCKGHFDGHKAATECAFQERLANLFLEL